MMPARIKVLVDDPSKCETKIALIQCIQPRDERRMYRLGDTYQYLDTAFASYHVIEDEEAAARESGFRSFPVSCFNWRRYEGDAPLGSGGAAADHRSGHCLQGTARLCLSGQDEDGSNCTTP
jgi:hypothetical protein